MTESYMAISRIRLRNIFYLIPFLFHEICCARQVIKSPGFVRGRIMYSPGKTFWTISVWSDLESVYKFAGQGAHRRAVPYKKLWCSEAATAHKNWDISKVPVARDAFDLLVESPNFAFTYYPSKNQKEMKIPKEFKEPMFQFQLIARN